MAYAKPVRITSESVDRNIRLQRDLDNRQRELESFGKESASLLSAAHAQTKIDAQRRILKQQICRTEQQQEEEQRKNTHERKFRELTISQNQALATELDKDAADYERRAREIQKICEEAPELKELEATLKTAYLNKERAAQFEEKILLATREQERIQAIEDEMEHQRLTAIRNEGDADKIKKAMYENQREILQRQINEKHEQLEEARRQIEQEREMVDEIIARINKEDHEDFKAKREKQIQTATMVKMFEAQRQSELKAARDAAQAEEERILAYQKTMDDRGAGVAAKKQAKKEEEDRIFNQIVEETERKRKQAEEFSSLRDMLWEEELEAKRAYDAKSRIDKQNKVRKEMMDANASMLVQKEVLQKQQAETEARLVAVMRQKFADDEALERREEDNKRNMKMHHMSLVEKQRIERKTMYESERAQEYAFIEENVRREEYRKKVIQEARKRLLEEHASSLGGFMPTKAFDNKQEYEEFLTSTSNRK